MKATQYYVYLLRCEGGSLYAGITTDLQRRFSEHAGKGGKGAKYTALRPPVRFEAAWTAPDRAEASRLERRLKAMSHGEKERLLREKDPAAPGSPACVRIPVGETGGIGG